MAIAIDTHAAIQELEEAGLESQHAQAIVKVVGSTGEHLATKGDIQELKGQLKGDIQALKGQLYVGLARLETKVLAVVIAATGLIITDIGLIIAVSKLL